MPGGAVSGRLLREAIDERVADGATLGELEHEVIDPSPLSEDARDALWLYAWSRLERAPAGTGRRVPLRA